MGWLTCTSTPGKTCFDDLTIVTLVLLMMVFVFSVYINILVKDPLGYR